MLMSDRRHYSILGYLSIRGLTFSPGLLLSGHDVRCQLQLEVPMWPSHEFWMSLGHWLFLTFCLIVPGGSWLQYMLIRYILVKNQTIVAGFSPADRLAELQQQEFFFRGLLFRIPFVLVVLSLILGPQPDYLVFYLAIAIAWLFKWRVVTYLERWLAQSDHQPIAD